MILAKFKAAGFHLLISGFLALLAAYIVFYFWYPSGLAGVSEGLGIFKLLITVEILLGPLISLVIFNTSKPRKELIRDYIIVGLIQISALIYGLYVIAISRPVYLVFVIDRIEVVAATELDPIDLNEASESFSTLPKFGPKLICVESPVDVEEKNNLLFSGLEGKDIQLFPKYYRDCYENEIRDKAFSSTQFEELTSQKIEDFDGLIGSNKPYWLPIVSRFAMWTVFFEEESIEDFTILDIYPFQVQD